ncbi:MAG: hypothetical protein R3A10_10755 [Caldilineaceae bacterium]
MGLLYDPVDGAVWVGGRGQLYRTLDGDGSGAMTCRNCVSTVCPGAGIRTTG